MAVKHSHDPKHFYGGLWSGNFYPALRQLGHEIVESQVDLLPASRFMHIASGFTAEEKELRARLTAQIVEEVKQAHQKKPVDLFLSYFYNAHFDPLGFDEIHRLGIPTMNFYSNSLYQFELVKSIAKKATYSWHPEKEARISYLRAGARPIWAQMGADPDIYHPIPDKKREVKACFVGQRYADRDRFLARLIENKTPLVIYGEGWRRASNGKSQADAEKIYLGRRVVTPQTFLSYLLMVRRNFDEQGIVIGPIRTLKQWQYRRETRRLDSIFQTAALGRAADICETFNQYEVILNFSHVWADGRSGSKLISHIRLRDFEAPMCRACYLTGSNEEIGEFYELGKEIDIYENAAELVDKTKFYLSHPEEAERLREAGYQRALRDHTWKNRFQELFRKIGLT